MSLEILRVLSEQNEQVASPRARLRFGAASTVWSTSSANTLGRRPGDDTAVDGGHQRTERGAGVRGVSHVAVTERRLVPLTPTVGPFLEAWLELRGDSPGPFFCPIDRAGTLRLPTAMTGEAIRQLLGRRRLAAGLAAMSPHDLRRTYASDLLDAGADLPAVQ